MRHATIAALAMLLLCALGACRGSGQAASQADERVRLRAAAFYDAWARGKLDTMRRLVSQNFRDDDPDLASLRAFMEKNRIKSFRIASVENELKLKRVTVDVARDGGEAATEVSYWKYERGDWYIEVLD
jgi:hypothetical protein